MATKSVFRCVACGETFASVELAEDQVDPALVHSETPGHRLVHDEIEIPRFAVGDRVRLHHAKSKNRKDGVVVKVGRTRVTIEVESLSWDHPVRTQRHIVDPDIKLIKKENHR